MLNGVYTPKLIGQYRKGTSESLLHGKPPTRWPTELCRWSIELSHFRNAIPLIRIRAYTFLYDENRPPAIPMMRCSLRFSEMTEWKIAAIERLLYPPDRWSGGGGSRGYQVHTECTCTWLSIGFFLRTIFAIEMNGKNRPSQEFRPIALK